MDDSFVREQYADVFDGIGLLEGKVHFQTDPSVSPVQMPLRRLPVAIREKVATELRILVQEGIIEPVSEPTPWVSALLVATKPDGSLCICIDPRNLNKALCRDTYLMPTIDGVLTQLTGAKVYSTADLKHGFWHCLFDHELSLLTAFEKPLGRFIWRRLWGYEACSALQMTFSSRDFAIRRRRQIMIMTETCWPYYNAVEKRA